MTTDALFIPRLESIIRDRIDAGDDGSYTAQLAAAGIRRIAQKVGEEGVEVALAATTGDCSELVEEAADLVYHLLVLLAVSDVSLANVDAKLAARHAD